jgi:hypothetical protein
LSHIVEHHWDHVRLMYDLPNGTTLAQMIIMSSVFPLTEILLKTTSLMTPFSVSPSGHKAC